MFGDEKDRINFPFLSKPNKLIFKSNFVANVTRFGKLSLCQSSIWPTYYYVLINICWLSEIEIRVKFIQETTYRKLFSKILSQIETGLKGP